MPRRTARKPKAVNATPKQQAIASMRASSGITGSEAYREVTQYDLDPHRTSVQASRMMLRAGTNAAVEAIYAEALATAPRSPSETRAMLINRLEFHAVGDGPAALKAIEMYGRLPAIDLWQEHGRSDDGDASSDTIREKLRAKLAGLLSAPAPGDTVVDVVAEVDEPEAPA